MRGKGARRVSTKCHTTQHANSTAVHHIRSSPREKDSQYGRRGIRFSLSFSPSSPSSTPHAASSMAGDPPDDAGGFHLPFYNGYAVDVAALLAVYALMYV